MIYNQLDIPEAAIGILKYAQNNLEENIGVNSITTLYEKLGRWEDALEVYESESEIDPSNTNIKIGIMRCLNALGEWEKMDSCRNFNFLRCN